MDYRQLPGTDIELSVLSFGPMRMPTGSAGAENDQQTLHRAIDAGITTIHSSAEYGPYSTFVDVLSRHPRRAQLDHVIKVQTPEYGEDSFDGGSFRQQVDDALLALGVERIAVVQHLQRGPASPADAYDEHGDALRLPRFDTVHEALFEAAEELKDEGKIGALMCFPHTMPFARRAVQAEGFDGFAHFFGPLEVEFAEFFDQLQASNRRFIAIRPLLQGMLTDARAHRDRLPDDDPRRDRNWDPWYEALEAVREALDEDPSSWTRFALRFSFTPEVVATSVVGLNTPAQLAEALRAVDEGPLPTELVETVVDVVASRPAIPKSTLF